MLIILQGDLDCRLLGGAVGKGFFFHHNFSDWVLIEELGDQKACLALALRQKPIMVMVP